MNTTELFTHIRNDLFYSTLPKIAIQSSSMLVMIGSAFNATDVMNEIAKSSGRSIVAIIGQNIIEFGLVNLMQNELNFERRLCIRIASVVAANTIKHSFLCSNKGIITVVIYPFMSGMISGVLFMLQNHDEANRYLRAKFPREFDMAVEGSKKIGIYKVVTEISRVMASMKE